MDLKLTNKSAVVLAASKGLGLAAALSLAAEGCKVAICARNKDRLKKPALKFFINLWTSVKKKTCNHLLILRRKNGRESIF